MVEKITSYSSEYSRSTQAGNQTVIWLAVFSFRCMHISLYSGGSTQALNNSILSLEKPNVKLQYKTLSSSVTSLINLCKDISFTPPASKTD